jgi:probable rRNA maturation factor
MAESGPSPDSFALLAGRRLDVEIVRHDAAWDDVADQMLARAARAALAEAPPLPAGDYELTILLTSDDELGALNRTWRGKDAPTNVLSFPAHDVLSGPGLLGDIALAYETIRDEARERGLSLADHVSHLVVHGVLHLLGFDHANDAEAERMEAFERKALASLGIADPYADQPHVSELLS